jgi:hypothetical protein
MRITLPLIEPATDDIRISEEVLKDFRTKCEIYVYKSEENWEENELDNVFGLWIEYGEDKENTLMFSLDLRDLEMFANSLTKSIEMLRRDYEDVLKRKIKLGHNL